MKNEKDLKFETLQVRAGYTPDKETHSPVVPIVMTTAYTFDSCKHGADLFALKEFGNIYTRLQNPTTDIFEKRMAALEGGIAALATSSGHAAQLITLTSLMTKGDNFVSSPYIYGGSYNQFSNSLRNLGLECRFSNSLNPKDFEILIDHNTKALFVESIANSNFSVPDIRKLADLAHHYNIPLIVDNTFGAGGYICRPFEHGADVIVESSTKWIGGHATSMGGVIIDSGNFNWGNGKFPLLSEPSASYHGLKFSETFGPLAFIVRARAEGIRDLGVCPSPFNSFMFLQGVETLSLRVARQVENTEALARYFAAHPEVESVNHTGFESSPWHENAKKYLQNGFGMVFSVVLKGDKSSTSKFVESLKLVLHESNVGDNRTMIVQPAATTHSQLAPQARREAGIEDTTLRISVGIEHIDDIIFDFDQAFEKMNG
jgi:O-acetylhomoserine (thiol)-lyase